MHSRRNLLAAASTSSFLALPGCGAIGDDGGGSESGGNGGSGSGGDADRPKSMAGVKLTEKVFEVRDGGSEPDRVVVGAKFDNTNSQEATLGLAFEVTFPDDTMASDHGGQYTAPPGESTFEGPIRLSAESAFFTESQVEYIKNGEYDYDIWITSVEGVSTGEVAEGECDPAIVNDEGTPTVEWEGYAHGGTSIESVDLTLTNLVDFPVQFSFTLLTFDDDGDPAPESLASRSGVIEGGEMKEYTITNTGLHSTRWDVEMSVSCP